MDYYVKKLGSPSDLNLYFIKTPAPRDLLINWSKQVSNSASKLKKKGVVLVSTSRTINGTLQMGITDISEENIDIVINTLRDKIPLGILEIYHQELPRLQ